MNVRQYQPGDEKAQLAIYNTAGAALSKFKPAGPFEIQRRIQVKDFDPATRWYAEERGQVVGYCNFQANGRISYPWCLPGFEHAAEPLFQRTLEAMRTRGLRRAFTAYRQDWPTINSFFLHQGFVHARDMVNFVMAFENMPTPSARLASGMSPLVAEDIPKILALAPAVFRDQTPATLAQALLHNPYLPPHSCFALRNRATGAPMAAGIFITEATYADPRQVDANMPCFRLGAFGTEGMTTKRIRGLFSFVAPLDKSLLSVGMDLLAHATYRLSDEDDISCYAAQVASDVPLLHAFYQRSFEKQGSFPVFERDLTR